MLTQYMISIRKYAQFSGRSDRKEFWTFVLVNLAITIVAAYAFAAVEIFLGKSPLLSFGESLNSIFSLLILAPTVTIQFRRLHDVNLNGWFTLLHAIPIIGTLILIVLFCKPGSPAANKYGSREPKIQSSANQLA